MGRFRIDYIRLRKVICVICFCLVLLLSTTTTVRVWALSSESQLRTIESQAHIDYENGKYLPAIFLLKQLLKIYPKDTGLMTDLASAEAELSNYTGALSLYKHALSIDPHHIGAMVGVGLISKKLGNNSTSTAFFKEAIAQPITSNDSRMIQVEKLEKAMSFIYIGNYSHAIDIANQVLKRDPTDFGALEVKAMSLIYMGKNAAALTVLNNLVSEGHAVPWVLDDRGVSLLNLDRYSGAIANFDAAIRLEPNDAYAYYNRAEAILNSDFHSQSYTIQQFEQHHQPLIFRHLDAALQDLNRVLIINPHSVDAINLKNLLIEGLRQGYLSS